MNLIMIFFINMSLYFVHSHPPLLIFYIEGCIKSLTLAS